MPTHASWRTLIAVMRVMLLVMATGCEPSVSARAVWIDVAGGERSPRIHVYDQGELREFAVVGADDPIASLRLDGHGRGVLIRLGEQRGAWIDLADGRRLPLLLPPSQLVGSELGFSEDGTALIWSDFDAATATGSLAILPVAPGLALEHDEQSGVQALLRPNAPRWWVSASDAPVALVAETDGTTLGLWRWPSDPDDAMVVRELASGSRTGLPSSSRRSSACGFPTGCVAGVAIDPEGEVAIFADDSGADWQRFDVRAPDDAELLSFPPALEQLIANGGIGLIHVIDRDRSLWLSSGLLHWWDQRSDELRSLPVLGEGPFHVFAIERGRGALFMSITGPVLRADHDGLRPVSLVTTPCLAVGDPVVSPKGGWLAWTCVDAISEFSVAQGAVVRVSALGLDRFAGVPMTPLAIDDEGHLLLASVVDVANDSLDGIATQNVPRNLYVLSREGVLTRIDELEPAPAAVFVGGEFGAFIQAASF